MDYEKKYIHPELCPAVGYQEVLVGVPVEIKPFAEIGKIKTECVCKPVICRGTSECEGSYLETCKFTINQKIRVEVPVVFGAKTEVGKIKVNCKCHEEQKNCDSIID